MIEFKLQVWHVWVSCRSQLIYLLMERCGSEPIYRPDEIINIQPSSSESYKKCKRFCCLLLFFACKNVIETCLIFNYFIVKYSFRIARIIYSLVMNMLKNRVKVLVWHYDLFENSQLKYTAQIAKIKTK